jgi:hypothetical protein
MPKQAPIPPAVLLLENLKLKPFAFALIAIVIELIAICVTYHEDKVAQIQHYGCQEPSFTPIILLSIVSIIFAVYAAAISFKLKRHLISIFAMLVILSCITGGLICIFILGLDRIC